jgi:PAS domain S-box-containing protein
VYILNIADEIFGYEKEGLEQKYAQEMMLKYTHASAHDALEKRRGQLSVDTTNAVYTVQMQYYTIGGELHWALDRAAVLTRNAQGVPIQALCAWTDITELKRAEEQVRALNETLEAQVQRRTEQLLQLNQEKEELLHIAAHDLKTPLQGIVLSAEVARQHLHKGNIDKVLYILNSIEHIGAAASETIETFLSANAIESGSFQLTLTAVPIEVLQETVERYQLRAKEKQQILDAQYPAVPLVIWADRIALREVMENLLSNAIKYSPLHKRVFVRVQRHISRVRIEVRDEGPGIQAAEMSQLFGKFARLSTKPTGGEHSTGLGLNIVKKLVEAMNGRVWCESEFGKGATFIVELPAA